MRYIILRPLSGNCTMLNLNTFHSIGSTCLPSGYTEEAEFLLRVKLNRLSAKTLLLTTSGPEADACLPTNSVKAQLSMLLP